MEAIQNSDLVTHAFLRAELANLKIDLIRWMIGLQVASVGLLFTLLRLV